MSEHVHEWEPLFESDTIQPWEAAEWRCECAGILTFEEIARRLNAVERLSADYCRDVARLTQELSAEVGDHMKVKKDDPLLAYAAALEGE